MHEKEWRIITVQTIFVAGAFYSGVWLKNQTKYLPVASWRTPNITGNNGRSPIYPFIEMPWREDHEELVNYLRQKQILLTELLTTYRLKQY